MVDVVKYQRSGKCSDSPFSQKNHFTQYENELSFYFYFFLITHLLKMVDFTLEKKIIYVY